MFGQAFQKAKVANLNRDNQATDEYIKKVAIVFNLKRLGYDIQAIHEATGLELEVINQIQ